MSPGEAILDERTRLKARIAELEVENAQLKARVAELESRPVVGEPFVLEAAVDWEAIEAAAWVAEHFGEEP